MKRRNLLAGAGALAAAPLIDVPAAQAVSSRKVMTGAQVLANDGWESGETDIIGIHDYSSDSEHLRERYGQKTNSKELFAKGLRDARGEVRTDWATAATKLPENGGAAGKAYLATTTAMAAAVDAKDPDAAMQSGGQIATIVFRDKDFAGKQIPRVARQRKLYVQSLRMLRDVRIKGGYLLGDDAVLVIEARNGIGWIERGAIVLTRDGDAWEFAGKQTVTYPVTR